MKTLSFASALLAAWCGLAAAQVKTGADMLFEKSFSLVEGKRIGLVTNHSAVLSNGKHLADALFEDKRVKLVALFGPEHGIRGDAPDGRIVRGGVDSATRVPVYSLYGRINKPTEEMLKGIDVLVFDIQDVGVRFYTYESTLSLAMEAAAERNIPFVVLDRPNPIRGTRVEGFALLDSMKSFVGLHPIPIAHGMTMGELATMFNDEGWLKNGVKANLTVVRMDGWKRTMWYDDTGLKWIRPSPNMAILRTAVVYPGTCLVEGTNLSEGRGTERPFEYIGAPFVDGKRWAEALNACHLPGVTFEAIEFVPKEIPNVASRPKYSGVRCNGVFVNVTDRNAFEPVRSAVQMLASARQLFRNEFQWRQGSIDRLAGTPMLRMMIDEHVAPQRIADQWANDVRQFELIRKKYLLY